MPIRVLLIEDEPGLRTTLTDRLRCEGYEVDSARDGNDGFEKARQGAYDLILLDLMLPGKSGLDVCRDLRQEKIKTAILMLTARGSTVDKVLGLKMGADDYLAKPFEMIELLARMEALVRRATSPGQPSGAAAFGKVRVNFRSTTVERDGQPVTLSAKEFQLLRYFLEHRGDTLSREELLANVWGYGDATPSRTVDVHVAWLRQKLEDDPRQPHWILTVHGHGYKFRAAES